MRTWIILLFVLLLSGCSKPDSVLISRAPTPGLFYTVENYYAGGPVSDTNRVYAQFEHDGVTRRLLVLEGENLTVKKLIWNDAHDVTLCIDGGITGVFRNEVTLIVGKSSVTVHNHLQERCTGESTRPPTA